MAPVLIILGVELAALGGVTYYLENVQEKIRLKPIDVKIIYKQLVSLFNYSLSDKFFNQKVYAYYIYGLILAQQAMLYNLIEVFDKDINLKKYKNTFPDWQERFETIKKDLLDTYARYVVYESLFKQIFGIPTNTRNVSVIKEKIPTFEYLTEKQLNEFITFLVNPLFKGIFTFEIENIEGVKCTDIPMTNKFVCKTVNVSYPLPLMDEEDPVKSIPDIIRPWYLYNCVALTKKLGADIFEGWGGLIDQALSDVTGIDKSFTLQGAKDAEDLKNTTFEYYDKVKKDLEDLQKQIKNQFLGFGTSSYESLNDIKLIMATGVGLLGVYVLYQIVFNRNNEYNY